ncbi:hypothetical protein EDB87DRAFT_1579050 [Lactarius vividus]|nr:hypothetical protein EDB87DRAFT_1579050 [Lactarius vividus]
MSLNGIDSGVLHSVFEHVFFPPKLPQEAPAGEAEVRMNVAFGFRQYLPSSKEPVWTRMQEMMGSIHRTVRAPLVEAELAGALANLAVGDVFVMHVRAQNAPVLVRVLIDHVRFEMFEVSPQASAVMSTNGRLLCSYPVPAAWKLAVTSYTQSGQ